MDCPPYLLVGTWKCHFFNAMVYYKNLGACYFFHLLKYSILQLKLKELLNLSHKQLRFRSRMLEKYTQFCKANLNYTYYLQ